MSSMSINPFSKLDCFSLRSQAWISYTNAKAYAVAFSWTPRVALFSCEMGRGRAVVAARAASSSFSGEGIVSVLSSVPPRVTRFHVMAGRAVFPRPKGP